MNIQAVIFDVDGVIVDSEFIFLNSITRFLKENSIQKGVHDLAGLLGRPEKEITQMIRDTFGMTEQYSFEQVWDGIYGEYSQIMRSGRVPPMEGFISFMDFLEENRIRTAVATSGTSAHFSEIVKGIQLKKRFDAVVTFEQTGIGKPAPDLYLRAIEQLAAMGVDREKMIAVEDSPNGIASAKASGLFTFGFKGSRVHQDTSCADREISTFEELKRIIKEENDETGNWK